MLDRDGLGAVGARPRIPYTGPVPGEPEIFLREESGPDAGRVHPLSPGRHRIGREPGVAVQLRGVDVSRHHASLEVGSDAISVEDLGSKNGVFRGGAPLTGPTPLRHGDVIVVGGISLSVHHPGAQVDAALVRGGEPTVTRAPAPERPGPPDRLGPPLLATLVFAALVAALLLWQ